MTELNNSQIAQQHELVIISEERITYVAHTQARTHARTYTHTHTHTHAHTHTHTHLYGNFLDLSNAKSSYLYHRHICITVPKSNFQMRLCCIIPILNEN